MTAAIDLSKFNPHDPAYSANPYPFYAAFRKQSPVHLVEPYKSYWVFRDEDVRRVLDEKETFVKNLKSPGPSPPPFGVMKNMPKGIFMLDPPRHTEIRDLVEPMFTKSIDDAGGIATKVARGLLVAAKSGRRFDLYSTYALPLPPQVLFSVMGVPQSDWQGLSMWVMAILAGHDITQPPQVQGMGGTCAMAVGGYYQALLSGCPAQKGRPRLLDQMVEATPDGMSIEEVQQTALNFNVAGYLSTTFLVATGTLNLLKNPDQLDMLRSEPALIDAAIEEMLRYDAPAQLVDRYATKNVKFGNVTIREGDPVTAVLGSANRDENAFPDPDRFDIKRDNSKQIAFGHGIHGCIGAPLVRMVAPAAFRTLLQELPAISLAGTPQWQTDPYLRSVSNLPIAID